ncbi:hypothetical protein [Enterobacter hormaechei]|uniref:hypothetical protein n=1 Tax=Enterobacter hormaechei TaxID=158836 RepID=UPI001039F8FD|nr:hypothetical protein [Enterobacter hormaechei]TBV79709.1 hypothetical protein E0F01_19205 [Enterobacter hormaechei]TKY77094.1 hypothetical protein E0F19_014520 [Enterobacter hormaechei]HED1663203.1 hypothetical protein [Enterobacter hormaechei subsp. steigerwaltii]
MNSNSQRTFKDLVSIYKAASFVGNSSASIMLDKDELCEILHDITQHPNDFGVTIESGNIALGETLTLHVAPPKIRLGQLHFSFNDYLKNSKNRIKEASNFFIVDLNFHNKERETLPVISRYRNVLRLITLFKECSAYLDETNAELVFVDTNVLKIPVNYTAEDLVDSNDNLIQSLIANFAEDTHKDQKLTILASSIKSLCESKSKDSSFSSMLRDLQQLSESFQKGYKVFVSGFSYDKILDQLRVAKIEEMGKIHKVFSDIQNQILGIPVATVIVATQMKPAIGWDGQALINTAVVLGALFFTVMILFVLFNQWQTLTAISDELKHKKEQAESNYKAIYDDIKTTFDSLTTRLLVQKIVFVSIGFIVACGLFLTFKFYFFLTPYTIQYLFH